MPSIRFSERSRCVNGHGWTILPLAPIHEDIMARRLAGAALIDPVPVRRLILSYPADRPVSRLARFAGEILSYLSEHVLSLPRSY